VLGKPADREDARRMLATLSGKPHVVATAVCLITDEGESAFVDETVVEFRALTDAQVTWYLGRGEWQGRAGGYAIQGSGASLVARIDGDFTTVVGLPLERLLGLLERHGLAPWS
jgi:septum formation protein